MHFDTHELFTRGTTTLYISYVHTVQMMSPHAVQQYAQTWRKIWCTITRAQPLSVCVINTGPYKILFYVLY